MFGMKMHLFQLLLAAILLIGLTSASDHWGYPDLDRGEDFPTWGGVCDTGKRQSPINLSLKGALKGVYDNFKFKNYDDKQSGVSMVNNGHSIQLSKFPFEMELQGGPLLSQYRVEQIHLHWWSEHTIDNVRYPLEAHIVHVNKLYGNMSNAVNHKDGIVVIGVLYHVSNERNEAIDLILENVDEVKSYRKIDKPVTMKEDFIVRDLFPTIEGYFFYAGSLTTPSCAESVSWIVLQETFPVTLDQVEKFKEIEYDENKTLKNNYRSIQNSNNRPVMAALVDHERGGASAPMHLSLAATLLLAVTAKLLQ